MMKLVKFSVLLLLIVSVSCSPGVESNDAVVANPHGPKKVEMKKNDDGNYRLFVDGEEFYVQGAGLEFGNREALASHGGNSFRTWRTDNGQVVLDEAERLGLMVMMGIEVARERHGFDYDNAELVAQQKEEIKQQVLKLKDHPALLGWGIGNELNLRYTNKKVWNAVNDIAKMIHEVDGNHPTTTMLAGIGKGEVDYIVEHCKDLDFISIQMYGDIINLQQRINDAGYNGPYLVTEWGATGHWEVGKTEWGAPIEENSTDKAISIRERYEKAILADQENCLGSYVFLWGQKQERTPTWYGLFTENGEETGAIDVMHYYWNENSYPDNRVPEINNISLNDKKAEESVKTAIGAEMVLNFEAFDPDEDELSIRFEVMHEATDLGDGGDKESRPETVEDLLVKAELGTVVFNAPQQPGEYRVFVYVVDENENVATVNVPFFVTE